MTPARIVVADPPWHFNNRHETRGKPTRFGRGAGEIYRHRTGRQDMGTMVTSDVCDMSELVSDVCSRDAYLFLWVPDSMIDDGLAVMRAWKFTFAKVGVWRKQTKHGKRFFGPGRYMPNEVEIYLLGRRGRCWHPNTGTNKLRQVLDAVRPPRHSRKPEEFYDALDAWFDPCIDGFSKLELFATRAREGWQCLGYEVTGNDIRDDLRKMREEP